MTRTASHLGAALAVASLAAAPAALAQDLPADVDPSRLRPPAEIAASSGGAASSAVPSIASPVVRASGGAARIALACPAGGAACNGTLTLHDLLAPGPARRIQVSLAAGEQRRVAIRVRRRRVIAGLVQFDGRAIGGVLVRA